MESIPPGRCCAPPGIHYGKHVSSKYSSRLHQVTKVTTPECIQLLKLAVEQKCDQPPLGSQIHNVKCRSDADSDCHLVVCEHCCVYVHYRALCKAAQMCRRSPMLIWPLPYGSVCSNKTLLCMVTTVLSSVTIKAARIQTTNRQAEGRTGRHSYFLNVVGRCHCIWH